MKKVEKGTTAAILPKPNYHFCDHCGRFRERRVVTKERSIICNECSRSLVSRQVIRIVEPILVFTPEEWEEITGELLSEKLTQKSKAELKEKKHKLSKKKEPFISFPAKVLTFMESKENGVKVYEVCQYFETKETKVWAALAQLKREGLITSTSRRKSKTYFHNKYQQEAVKAESRCRKLTEEEIDNKLLEIVNTEQQLMAASEVRGLMTFYYPTDGVRKSLNRLFKKGEIGRYQPFSSNTYYYYPKEGEGIKRAWDHFSRGMLITRIFSFINNGVRTRQQIADFIGHNRKSYGTVNRAIALLEKENKIRTYKKERTLYVEAIKEGG